MQWNSFHQCSTWAVPLTDSQLTALYALLCDIHNTRSKHGQGQSSKDMHPPRPPDFQAPVPVIIAGQQAKRSTDDVSAPPQQGTSTTPMTQHTPTSTLSPSTSSSTSDSALETEGKEQHPEEPAAGGKVVSLPPPPPKVVSGRDSARGSKAATAAAVGRGGRGGGDSYKPPSWGLATAPNASGMSLTVLKGGVEVNSISLDNRTHILLGRQQGVVDVLLEHPSISRKHAILQHGQNGALFLLDNGSTHGCSVNKVKIPPKEFHKLNVGDVIKFGESTRLYALEGPEELRPAEYESDNLRNLRLEAGRKQLAKKLAKLKAGAAGKEAGEGGGDSGEYGISWGFDEDAVAEEEDEDGEGMEGDDGEVELPDYLKTEAQKRRRRDTKVGLSEDSVHKRDAKLFEKLQLKLTKVEHLLTENERITAKEGGQGGLTEGQQAQLGRNDKAVTSIRLQIEEIEETIRSKNKARERGKEGEGGEGGGGTSGAGGAGEGGGAAEVGEEDDDYYDRTAPVVRSSARTPEGGAISKKEEIRARRFGARDKSKKLALAPTNAAAASTAVAAAGGGRAKLGGGISSEGGGETVAQSLEALTRRADAVAQDLERAESGLVELEVEEAEEAGEARGAGGEEEVAADPLDMFMASNRKNERQQAMLRLSAQRDSLREERALLKAMVEAARPSMPSLKPAAGNPVAAGIDAAAAVPGSKFRGSSPQSSSPLPPPPSGGALAAGEALAAAGVALPRKPSEEEEEEEEPVVRTSRHSNGGGDATDVASGGGSGGDIIGGSSSAKEDGVEVKVPSMSAPMAAPAALPRRPGAGAAAAAADRTPLVASQAEAAGDRGGDRGNGDSNMDVDNGSGSGNKEGAAPIPAPQELKSGNTTTKKRGTPVGASMLPPPPGKRPQLKRNTSTAADNKKEDDMSAPSNVPAPSNAKRAVTGPVAMPPPPVASGSAGGVTAGAAGGKKPRKEEAKNGGVKVAGKGVLEGGDADWVPPKGQAGDGRTALNLKFGY